MLLMALKIGFMEKFERAILRGNEKEAFDTEKSILVQRLQR